jgi:hypothetical protein
MTVVIDGTTGISGVDGTAASPAFEGNDTNTGIFFPAADTVAVTTGGTERMRVASSGNVGIGTSSPLDKIDVVTDAGIYGGSRASNVNKFWRPRIPSYSGTSNFFSPFFATSEASENYMRIGGGTSTAYAATTIQFYTAADSTTTTGTERARIDSSGNLLVGTAGTIVTNYQSRFGVMATTFNGNQGFIGIGATITTSVDLMQFINPNGLVGRISTSGSATSYVTSSDYRLKEEIAPMTGALAKVAALKPCTYKWKADGSDGEGFIAHELAEVVPDAVTGEKDAVDEEGNIKPQGIDTSFLVATLTAAIQELNAKVDAQAAEIAALKEAK